MATTLNFKDIIDIPLWRPAAPALANALAGQSICYDKRNSERNAPYSYYMQGVTSLQAYLPSNDGWGIVANPALAGTMAAGAACIFHPTQGPRGTIAAGATTTTLTLTTALPAAVGLNQLANNGAGEGFFIRIIDNGAGGTGQTAARRIVANTAGTTPALVLDSALPFTPVTGAAYEFRSGRVFMLSSGALAAGMWKYYDVATNSVSGNLATTNLPATVGGDSDMVALSEGHIPYNATVSTGFLGNITATAAGATTITGSGMRATLQANEYRNFQVRIVTDATNPTAAGQRRRISSHTGGATGVFTVAAWAVTPSATATFVVENDDDKILLFTNQTSVYTYNITANTWDTTTFAAAANAGAAGVTVEQAFGIAIDAANPPNARHSFIYRVRGNVVTIDLLDIAGAATGSWSAGIVYGGTTASFGTGSCGAYDPVSNAGRYWYLSVGGGAQFMRFDMLTRTLEPWTVLRYTQGTAVVGRKLSMAFFIDGSTTLGVLYALRNSGAEQFSILCQR
jgi:hypothetical protein